MNEEIKNETFVAEEKIQRPKKSGGWNVRNCAIIFKGLKITQIEFEKGIALQFNTAEICESKEVTIEYTGVYGTPGFKYRLKKT